MSGRVGGEEECPAKGGIQVSPEKPSLSEQATKQSAPAAVSDYSVSQATAGIVPLKHSVEDVGPLSHLTFKDKVGGLLQFGPSNVQTLQVKGGLCVIGQRLNGFAKSCVGLTQCSYVKANLIGKPRLVLRLSVLATLTIGSTFLNSEERTSRGTLRMLLLWSFSMTLS